MTDPSAAEDIAGLNEAVARLRAHVPSNQIGDDIGTLLAEFDRMRDKLDAISAGKTVLIMSDDDRAKAAVDLDDDALAKWCRATLVALSKVHEKNDGNSAGKLVAMHGVISLAVSAKNFNAGEITFKVGGVTYKGEEAGDWEVTVREQGPTAAEELLHRFRHFVLRTRGKATEGHPIWPEMADLLDEAGITERYETGPEYQFMQPGNTKTLDMLRHEAKVAADG